MLRILIGALCALSLAGCSMVTSYNTALLPDGGEPSQGGGGYHLPKHILIATVIQSAKGPPDITLVRKSIADPLYPMNVGFKLSPTSDDDIQITYQDGLITKITASADDKTKEVIENLTKSIVASFGRSGADGSDDILGLQTKVLQVAFDPFDENELARSNEQLMRLGFCLAFAPDSRNPEAWGCPTSTQRREYTHRDRSPSPVQIRQMGEGLFFRQPAEHKIQLFQRHGPRCKNWCLRWEGYAAFANAGPLLRIDVDRTLFVKRETIVQFGAEGVPTDVHVKKPSEAVVAANIPLVVTKAILAAPAEAFTSATTTTDAQKKYIDSQKSLLDSQTQYVDAINTRLKNGQPIPPGHDIGAVLGTTPARSADASSLSGQRSSEEINAQRSKAKFYQYCSDIGLDRGGCDQEWRRANPS